MAFSAHQATCCPQVRFSGARIVSIFSTAHWRGAEIASVEEGLVRKRDVNAPEATEVCSYTITRANRVKACASASRHELARHQTASLD